MIETLAHGYSSESILSESYPMDTNMTGFRCFSLNLCVPSLWTKVALALGGLKLKNNQPEK